MMVVTIVDCGLGFNWLEKICCFMKSLNSFFFRRKLRGKNKGKGQETRKGSSYLFKGFHVFDMLFSGSHVLVVSGILLVKFMNKPNSFRIQ